MISPAAGLVPAITQVGTCRSVVSMEALTTACTLIFSFRTNRSRSRYPSLGGIKNAKPTFSLPLPQKPVHGIWSGSKSGLQEFIEMIPTAPNC